MVRTQPGRTRHSSSLLLFLLMGLSFLCGCNGGKAYSHYESVPIDGWRNNDTIRFELGPVMEGGTFHDEIALRTTSAYPYTRLSLVVIRQVLPDGGMHTDSITMLITDDKGTPKGSGTTHRHYSLLLSPIHIEKDQRLAVSIYHNMKKESLPGISDLGMTITRK